jgi:hypothetical protein
MKTITAQKPFEELSEALSGVERIYVVGCGTCATMLHTGGKSEVLAMKEKLEAAGKKVTGWMVIPTACDELEQADVILAMTCAFGVQTVTLYTKKPVYPALNTLFVGKEEIPGHFTEVCMQCGNCILAKTAGMCPLVRCAKSLLNGPCGGSVGGKCEVSPDIPCAWQVIYDRLAALGQLDKLEEILPIRDWSTSREGGPRTIIISD